MCMYKYIQYYITHEHKLWTTMKWFFCYFYCIHFITIWIYMLPADDKRKHQSPHMNVHNTYMYILFIRREKKWWNIYLNLLSDRQNGFSSVVVVVCARLKVGNWQITATQAQRERTLFAETLTACWAVYYKYTSNSHTASTIIIR